MEEYHLLRPVRSNPTLTALIIAQRQMSASTPPILNNETRVPLPEECHIPLPPSPTLSAQDAENNGEHSTEYHCPEQSSPLPLLELLRAIQEDKYESRRLAVLQDEAYGLFHKCGSCDRFLTVQAQLYRCMMDCFRNDKKTAFASLYTKAMSYPAFGELRIKGPVLDEDLDEGDGASWLERLPADSRISLIDFLCRLRTDPAFVADRISRLSSSQLRKLTQLHGPLETGPIFRGHQSQGRYNGRNARGVSKSSDSEISVEDLLCDPLLLLVHGVFDRNHSERFRQIDVWSSVCAKLVEDGKPGSDEFCITIVNLFVDLPDWNVSPKLELFLADLITAGGPFLEAGGHNIKFTHPQQRDTTSATSSFLDAYIPRLLDILSNTPAPSQAMDLISSILTKISDPNRRLAARNFFFRGWYCASFLANAVIYPENHGILMEHYISSSIRQKVLRELVLRIQSLVSDMLSPWSVNTSSNPSETKIQQILALFEQDRKSTSPLSDPGSMHRCFLFLRPEDVLAMAKALMAISDSGSSATSLFEQTESSSSSFLAYQNQFTRRAVDPYKNQNSNGFSASHSQTWHGPHPGVDSGYNTMERGTYRPGTSGHNVNDSEKYGALPFVHDLWMLNASRDFQLPSSSGHEVAIIFASRDSQGLSLNPFCVHDGQNLPNQSQQALNSEDQKMLTAAILRLADHTEQLQQDYHGADMGSLGGFVCLFRDKAREANDLFDFQGEYFWWQCLHIIRSIELQTFAHFLKSFAEHRKAKVAYKRELAKQYDDWLYALRTHSNMQDQQNQKLSLSSKRLRNKMWYISDVRHSSAYEDAHNVVRALRAMLEPTDAKQAGVTGWAKQRFRSSLGQERALSQLMELMTAPKVYGGPNKLSENQVEITTGWLLHENIENFCRGEERIHRFCYEVQKCVKRLAGEALLDSPVLWSSPLYANEKSEHGITASSGSRHQPDRPGWRTDFSYPQWSPGQTMPGQSPFSGPEVIISPTGQARSFERPLQPSFQQPLPLNQGNGANQIPRNWMLPPSPISPGNVKISHDGATLRRRSFLQNLRAHLTSLLLSDLGSLLWNYGSETDRWISALDHQRRRSLPSSKESNGLQVMGDNNSYQDTNALEATITPPFNFTEAYHVLLHRFRFTTNPQTKLRHLHDFFVLICHARHVRKAERLEIDLFEQNVDDEPLSNLGIGIGVPRTRLTRLQEVAANCEDRRISSISNSRSGPVFDLYARILPKPHVDDSDLIAAVQTIFEDPTYRPATFFRDLQYIAALTPSSVLDHTPQGTAFWTIGLAAMRIKSEKCKIITENAMQILDFHYGNGSKKEPLHAGESSPSQSSTSTFQLSQQDLLGTTLKDAARLLTTSALEGDPTAARELALFHLTHPELVSRVTLPLSRPSDVFGAKHGLASERPNRGGNEESGILDSVTFAVVFHWMEFAANAGDVDALTFFKENKDLGKAL